MREAVHEQAPMTGQILTEDALYMHIDRFNGGKARLETTLFHKGSTLQQYAQEGTHSGVVVDEGPYPEGASRIRGLAVTDSVYIQETAASQGQNVWGLPHEATVTEANPETSIITWLQATNGTAEAMHILTLTRA